MGTETFQIENVVVKVVSLGSFEQYKCIHRMKQYYKNRQICDKML